MEKAFYFSGILVFISTSIYFGLKSIEWYRKYKSSLYQTNLAHFLSDLYKVQNKWSRAGEFGYAESIGNVIKFHGLTPTDAVNKIISKPLTNDAVSTDIQLKNLRKEEFKEFTTEFIG